MKTEGGESPRLGWGVDGFGNRHYICDIIGKNFGIMTNAEHYDFEERYCSKCKKVKAVVQVGL